MTTTEPVAPAPIDGSASHTPVPSAEVPTPAPAPTRSAPLGRGVHPHVIVLFGAAGDLARRKLLPGLFRLTRAGMLPETRIVGTSMEDLDDDGFRELALDACKEFVRGGLDPEEWRSFSAMLGYVPLSAGPGALVERVEDLESGLDGESRRLHYLSVPPAAAPEVVRMLGATGLNHRARIIMEKPFGFDLATSKVLNSSVNDIFAPEQVYRIDHFLGKEAALNILAFRFANGLFEPIWNRQLIDHIQIDVPEMLSVGTRGTTYDSSGAFRDMVVTHLFQILAFVAMEPPTALEPDAINEEKDKVFRSMLPLDPQFVTRGQYEGYRDTPGVAADSETETFVALRCEIDNWRWAGVPFYLRTGKEMAEGSRIVSVAFKEPPRSMFPAESNVSSYGPDHLTFDLSDSPKLSLSFYGKRPGPGMVLDKLSLQFALQETEAEEHVLEAYERLIYDAMRGDQTLFTSAAGIERLWEVSQPLIDDPPAVHLYRRGSWGPTAMHSMIAPHTWRLPFERRWREK